MADPRLIERFRAARRDPALAVLEGFHPVKHAIRFGAELLALAVTAPDRVAALAAAVAPDVAPLLERAPVTTVSDDVFSALAPRPPATGILAIARRPPVDAAAILARPEAGAVPASAAPVVLLEAPARLENVGATVRVAAAAAAAGVLTTGVHDPWDPAALRGAAGLHFALPVARVDGVPASPRPLVAVHTDGEPLRSGALPPDAILAFGSERRGLSAGLLAAADRRVRIPMRPGISSLNLATAVAAALYLGWTGAGGGAAG